MLLELPELPEDIIISIFTNLEIPDLIRAGSICSSWHSAYVLVYKYGLCKQPQTPCLLFTTEYGPNGESDIFLYSLVEKKSYVLSLPDPPIRSRRVIGSSHDWIITADDVSELFLLNPITGDQIALPSITTIEQIDPVYDDNGVVRRYLLSFFTGEDVDERPRYDIPLSCESLRDLVFYKVILSADPSIGNYYVVLIHNPEAQLSFARGGDNKWTWLPQPQHCCFVDCIFKDNLLYALTLMGEIHTFDLSGPTITHKINMDAVRGLVNKKIYLFQDQCGDLLQVRRDHELPVEDEEPPYEDEEPLYEDEEALYEDEKALHEDEKSLYEDEESLHEDEDISGPESEPRSHAQYTPRFKVYKVDFAAKKLVERTSLGEDSLFLGHNQSLFLYAKEHPKLKANHVYFTDGIPFSYRNDRDIKVLNLENNISEKVLPKELCSNWPGPVWMQLNPPKMISASQNN